METSGVNKEFEGEEMLVKSETSADHIQLEHEGEDDLSEESESSAQAKSQVANEDQLVFLEAKPKSKSKVIFNITDAQYNIVKKVGRKIFKWKLSSNPNHDWDVCWTDKTVPIETLAKMQPYQKINHFPGIKSIARKNHLGRNLMKMYKMFPKSYNFFPKTFLLPFDFHEFKSEFSKGNKKNTFIIKPEANSQGRGIFLTKTWENIDPKDRFVAQKYIKNPYLIDGLKFDLRIYVLLAGCDPLKIFLYEDGLGRFATEPYRRPNNQNLASTCMHLTNYAINKDSPNFIFNNSSAADDVGHKKSLKAVFKILEEQGHDTKALWEEIKKIIIKVLCSVQPLLAHYYRSCHANEPYNNMCFEILGFDVMLDKKLKPWLIEVNHLPSFSTDTPLDENIKRNVIKDALQIMNISAQDKFDYKEKKKEAFNQKALSRKVKLSAEEKKSVIQKAQQERDEWESKNHGGYEKIFPPKDEEEAEAYFKFMRAAGQNSQTWVGADVRKEGSRTMTRQESNQEIQQTETEISKRLNLSPQPKRLSVSPKNAAKLHPKRTPSFKNLQSQIKEDYKVQFSSKHKEKTKTHCKESQIGPWAQEKTPDENDINFISQQSIRGWDEDLHALKQDQSENGVNLSNSKNSTRIEKSALFFSKSDEQDTVSATESNLTQRENVVSVNGITEGTSGNHSERISSLQKGMNKLKILNPYGLGPKKSSRKANQTLSLKEQKSECRSTGPSRALSSTEEAIKTPAKRITNPNRNSACGVTNLEYKSTKDNLKRKTFREESGSKLEKLRETITPRNKPSSHLGSPKCETKDNTNKKSQPITRHKRSISKNETSPKREVLKKITNRNKATQSASKTIQNIEKESKTVNEPKVNSKKIKQKAIQKKKVNNEENEQISKKITFHLSKETLNTLPKNLEQENPKIWPSSKLSVKIDNDKVDLRNQVLTPTLSPQYYKVKLGQDSSPLNTYEGKSSYVKSDKPKKSVFVESEISQLTSLGLFRDFSSDGTPKDSTPFSPKVKKVQSNNFFK